MAKTAAVHTRIDPEIKRRAEGVLHHLGMKPSDAIQVFYQQIALRGGFPVELKVPNALTRKTLKESRVWPTDGAQQAFERVDCFVSRSSFLAMTGLGKRIRGGDTRTGFS